jgi:hypothetical protein
MATDILALVKSDDGTERMSRCAAGSRPPPLLHFVLDTAFLKTDQRLPVYLGAEWVTSLFLYSVLSKRIPV